MRNTWAVCKREFAGFFLTPVGYVAVGMVAVISGLAFTLSLLAYARMSQAPSTYGYSAVPDFEETMLSPFLVFCGILIMFLSPLISMRLLAEERHRGTIELLFTHPLRDRDIVFGKYLAALGMLLVMAAVIGVDLLLLGFVADIEPAVLVFGLLAMFLMDAAFLSLGLFVSAVARSPVTAGIVTFGLSMLLYIFGALGDRLPEGNPAPAEWAEALRGPVGAVYAVARRFVQELAVDSHAQDMALGIVQPRDIAYYLLFTAFFLFLTFRALESRQWRAQR